MTVGPPGAVDLSRRVRACLVVEEGDAAHCAPAANGTGGGSDARPVPSDDPE